MATFLTGSELNSEIENLIRGSLNELILISPYIRLHERLKDLLKIKQNLPEFSLMIIFGKNDEDRLKSISAEDLSFFKEFLDVEIRYQMKLHAKFYANENTSIVTSMNLYDFSMNNNIEAGVVMWRESSLKSRIIKFFSQEFTYEDQTDLFLFETIESSELIYKKEAMFEKKLFREVYTESKIIKDELESFFKVKRKIENEKETKFGFCIRTGKKIKFDPSKPMTLEAYKSWSKYKNPEFPEKYCHKTGKPSNGKTSMQNPILNE